MRQHRDYTKKKGFEIVGTIPNYYYDGEDAYLMVLNLAGQ